MNRPMGTSDDDSFLQHVEDILQKTFLLNDFQNIAAHFFRVDFIKSLDQFVDEAGFHARLRGNDREPKWR